jgi:hypothetical protein
LTADNAVVLYFDVANQANEVPSCLDQQGWLVDIEDVIARGYHSGTACYTCGEGLDGHEIPDDSETNHKEKRQTRRVEYYRLWGGGTWDTDFIDIPADTPDDQVDQAIRKATERIQWRDDPPVIVGCYNDGHDGEPGSLGCVNCGRTDLPLHVNRQCAECGPDEKQAPRIRAECHSDDRIYSAQFDALPWFQQATDGDILNLAEEGWGDGYAADEVGMFITDTVADVQKMFDYLEHYNQPGVRHIGWVCTVNKDDVLQWLESHRPQLQRQVLAIEERISG